MHKQISIVLLSFVFLMGCSGTLPKLGVMSDQLTPCPSTPNCVSSQATDKEHYIQPIHFTGTPQDAQDRLLQILNTLERTEIIVVQENYIRVAFTSKIFQFVDDVEFYFPATDTEHIIINFRSASRIGYSDLGANQKRIEQIRDTFKEY
ncbi:DUF1499 domain-containing protein [Paraglaciecola sp. MB-3u-78]|jgi:uncharacterized protein (DUF1499 family)|uniref:DUF1499 domain-containing protein n=1 Tax=Paraglaciecola sp. MB-3u-78 TaxID=2058332 RepID=UPI000C32AAAA|nr:DUF1499 domain-containing protein [Paraglaciecola sp. MB-3u-78]PKG96773.1 DUF1499 domain-containing protein [Paraglaciecola sp. MB-3u-78]